MSLVVHPLMYSNTRDLFFMDVHDLKERKDGRIDRSLSSREGAVSSFVGRRDKLSIQPKDCQLHWTQYFSKNFFFQIRRNIHNFNITDKNCYFCWPPDVLNTTVAIPQTDKHKQTRRTQKLIKTLIFHLWFWLLPLENKLLLFASLK